MNSERTQTRYQIQARDEDGRTRIGIQPEGQPTEGAYILLSDHDALGVARDILTSVTSHQEQP